MFFAGTEDPACLGLFERARQGAYIPLMNWEKRKITVDSQEFPAVAPLIISASRRTDIPGFHSDSFFAGLKRGWFGVPNPFEPKKIHLVSTELVRFVVFWSKNPAPAMGRLAELDAAGIGYYFLYTLNDYVKEGWEPGVPGLQDRLETFVRLSGDLGPDRVLWRFDPLVLSASLGLDELIERIAAIGIELKGRTQKLIFSFLDKDCYPVVRRNFPEGRELTVLEMEKAGRAIASLSGECGFEAASCAEEIDLSGLGIRRNSCIDERLIRKISAGDPVLTEFLDAHEGRLKDKGQRQACGCAVSRDIGSYGSCGFGCRYCYARKKLLGVGR